jgi:mRNA-degrading endonuclease YafQ of YafQ-DinJ toxin-antitoxin module
VTFEATEEFWKNFYDLSAEQKDSVRQKWLIFRENQFHPSLGSHKIYRLSALAKHTIWSVVIQGDLRVLFRIDDSVVTTLDIGTHKVYQ